MIAIEGVLVSIALSLTRAVHSDAVIDPLASYSDVNLCSDSVTKNSQQLLRFHFLLFLNDLLFLSCRKDPASIVKTNIVR